MSGTCPDCGEKMEFTDQEVRLRTGTCGACSHAFTFVAGSALAPTPSAETPPAAPAAIEVEGGPECAECGTPLAFRAGEDGAIEAYCEECDTSLRFVPEGSEEPEAPAPRERGRRFERRDEGPGEGPRGRPCRQCGAPLRFSTNDEGLLVGECSSCGNRFTLPPRDRVGGGRPGYDARGGGGRFPPRGGPGRFRGRPEGRGPPSRRFSGPPERDGERRKRRRTRE